MPYRIVILNGDRRGERLDVNTSTLTIGRDASCSLPLTDPRISPVHAQVFSEGDTLGMRVSNEADCIRVNGTDVREAHLKHGDVVEIGDTRFFIQAHDTSAWGTITDLRRRRIWLTVALPITLLLIIIALVGYSRRSTSRNDQDVRPTVPATLPPPAPASLMDDSDVTNAPRISINSNINVSVKIPEVESAKRFMAILKTNSVDHDAADTRAELDLAARFLRESAGQNPAQEAATNQTADSSLMQARTLLGETGTSSNKPDTTNVVTNIGTNSPSFGTNTLTSPP